MHISAEPAAPVGGWGNPMGLASGTRRASQQTVAAIAQRVESGVSSLSRVRAVEAALASPSLTAYDSTRDDCDSATRMISPGEVEHHHEGRPIHAQFPRDVWGGVERGLLRCGPRRCTGT